MSDDGQVGDPDVAEMLPTFPAPPAEGPTYPYVEARIPRNLRVTGGLMFALGTLDVISLSFGRDPATTEAIIGHVGASLALVVGGLGLIRGRRWAWPVALLVALAAIGYGIYLVALPGDITEWSSHSSPYPS